MLWVSEGFTVYYEDLILNRAGLLTRDEILERFRSNIARYENVPGHLFQSATESSFDTWIQFFSRGRERGQHHDLLLRQGRRARDASGLQDPERDEEPEVPRRRDADSLSEILQREKEGLHRRGVPRGLRKRGRMPAGRDLRCLCLHGEGHRLSQVSRLRRVWTSTFSPRKCPAPYFGAATQRPGREPDHLERRMGFSGLARPASARRTRSSPWTASASTPGRWARSSNPRSRGTRSGSSSRAATRSARSRSSWGRRRSGASASSPSRTRLRSNRRFSEIG